MTSTNLKLGTFNEAMRNCEELMTPLVCFDDELSLLLTELIIDAEYTNSGEICGT